MKKIVAWGYVTAILLTACSKGEQEAANAYVGQPVPISILLEESDASLTRTPAAMTQGTAYLTGGANGMKAYTYSGEGITAADPLLWTASTMTIYGYYADGGQTAVGSNRSYSASNATNASFLAGKTTATYSQSEQQPVNITLRQQLAYVSVTVRSDAGSEMTEAKLGNGMLYTNGTFDNTTFSATGYATGGTNSTGWSVSGNRGTVDMAQSETVTTANTSSTTFYAIIIPQAISNTTTPFFTVLISGYSVGFRLNNAQTFKAGSRYNLVVDYVTHTLHVESMIEVKDFEDSGSSTNQSNVDAS